jgi:CheY-like chemotaxis protein
MSALRTISEEEPLFEIRESDFVNRACEWLRLFHRLDRHSAFHNLLLALRCGCAVSILSSIILDIMLPGMDGIELLSRLRR